MPGVTTPGKVVEPALRAGWFGAADKPARSAGSTPFTLTFPFTSYGASPANDSPNRIQKGIVNSASAVVPRMICTATSGWPP
jgi:hypothetical protein